MITIALSDHGSQPAPLALVDIELDLGLAIFGGFIDFGFSLRSVCVDLNRRLLILGGLVDFRLGLGGVGFQLDIDTCEALLDLAAPTPTGFTCLGIHLAERCGDARRNFRRLGQHLRIQGGDRGHLDHLEGASHRLLPPFLIAACNL
jgi:hypothetical protein